MEAPERRTLRSSRVRRWLGHLFREWTYRKLAADSSCICRSRTLQRGAMRKSRSAWIGHATVLINFLGVKILTDPVLFPRIGIRLPGFTIGPKRLTAPALQFHELPPIDLILLSHAHFDHFDLRTLRCFSKNTTVITRSRTPRDLLRHTRFRDVTRARLGRSRSFKTARGEINISALRCEPLGRAKTAGHISRL